MKIREFCSLPKEEFLPIIMRYLKEKDIFAYYDLVKHKNKCKKIKSVKIYPSPKYYYFTLSFLTSKYKVEGFEGWQYHTFSTTISTPAFLKWLNGGKDDFGYILSKPIDTHKRIRKKHSLYQIDDNIKVELGDFLNLFR